MQIILHGWCRKGPRTDRSWNLEEEQSVVMTPAASPSTAPAWLGKCDGTAGVAGTSSFDKCWIRNKKYLLFASSGKGPISPGSQVSSVPRRNFAKKQDSSTKPRWPQTTGAYGDICLVEPLGLLWWGQEVIVGWAQGLPVSWQVKGNHTALSCTICTSS